ncbi:glycosyltransferase family 61 protein [Metabacillus arenae]|uniref:DUF563 domain-containing protein n=1 Tax=Metabacillus arenae TaxID=2771434 RepID=A0A926N936_9BACI|nr:glycosyltransferase 61 family protein [Metabacillus arenae]MBD1378989.1 DUF563 domain-containing protein [Metabacillus arenae]
MVHKSNNFKLSKLKLVDYKDICNECFVGNNKVNKFQDNTLYIFKRAENTRLSPLINVSQEVKLPNSFTSKDFYVASIKNGFCMQRQVILKDKKFILPDSFRRYETLGYGHSQLPYNLIDKTFDTLDISNIRSVAGEYIFLSGEVSSHFGHFLLEVVSRLWIAKYLDLKKYKFIMNPFDKFKWQLDILKALGIRQEQIYYLDNPTIFERVLIPVQAFALERFSSTFATDTWNKIGAYYDTGLGPEKIYVSRSKIQHKRRLLNELVVEKIFSSHGFKIIHPQELEIKDQINTFRNAKFIAGPAGSAMYNCIFQKNASKKLIMAPPKFIIPNDILINGSSKCELNYFIGKNVGNEPSGMFADWIVDIDKLSKFIKKSILR